MNNDFAPFELAVKLKEKGYPQHITDEAYITDNYGEDKYEIGDRLPISLIPDYMDDVASPTISQVLKWLREEKKIHIQILFTCPPNKWEYITVKMTNNELRGMCATFTSYEQAALAGVNYCLEKLI